MQVFEQFITSGCVTELSDKAEIINYFSQLVDDKNDSLIVDNIMRYYDKCIERFNKVGGDILIVADRYDKLKNSLSSENYVDLEFLFAELISLKEFVGIIDDSMKDIGCNIYLGIDGIVVFNHELQYAFNKENDKFISDKYSKISFNACLDMRNKLREYDYNGKYNKELLNLIVNRFVKDFDKYDGEIKVIESSLVNSYNRANHDNLINLINNANAYMSCVYCFFGWNFASGICLFIDLILNNEEMLDGYGKMQKDLCSLFNIDSNLGNLVYNKIKSLDSYINNIKITPIDSWKFFDIVICILFVILFIIDIFLIYQIIFECNE